MNQKVLSIGLVFLFLFSTLIPVTFGNNIKISNAMEQHFISFYHGNTLYVGGNGSGNYSMIQDAINNASFGDTVFVYSGAYCENVVVDKTINLIGEDRNTTIIDAGFFGDVVKISANGVVLNGFTIQNGKYMGIYFSSDWNQIFGNIIRNNSNGIYLDSCVNNNTIRGNSIIYNINRGVWIDDKFKCCYNNLVTGNFIVHNGMGGIWDFDGDGGTTATWNIIADNGKIYHWYAGGIVTDDSYSVFHHNDLLFNWYNAAVDFGRFGNTWDDGSEGNFWDDWEDNPGYPDVYIIEDFPAEDIDRHPSATPYSDNLIVSIPYPYYALVDEPINFSADIYFLDIYSVLWFWDFGDGNTSNEVNPYYSYGASGHYYLSVTVTDNQGRSDTSYSEVYIGKPPEKPTITGPTSGKPGIEYNYTFVAIDPDADDVYYDIYWGYQYGDEFIGPYSSGEEVTLSHSWAIKGIYEIRVKAIDTADLLSPEATLDVTIPRSRVMNNLFFNLFEKFPLFQKLLYQMSFR